jgi:hypothetical protein
VLVFHPNIALPEPFVKANRAGLLLSERSIWKWPLLPVPIWCIENKGIKEFAVAEKGRVRLAGESGPRLTSSVVGSAGPTI